MAISLRIFGVAVLLAGVSSAAAQPPSGAGSRPNPPAGSAPNLPPIPPGVRTTPENAHLPTEGEIKLGREGVLEVEKQYKVLTSGSYHDRLQRVVREVVRAAQSPEIVAEFRRVYQVPRPDDRSKRVPFEYTFKVLDTTREVNAFSLPGGPIYVTRGLMDQAISDHELAGVLAHECVHVAFHHAEQLIKKSRKLNTSQMWALLAAAVAGVAGGGQAAAAAGNILMGAQFVSIATLTGYGQDLETEADKIGALILTRTGFHPLGIYTFMQKLARDERRRGNPDYGIYRSHPYTNQRVTALQREIRRLGYSVDPGVERRVSGAYRLEVTPHQFQGREAAELRLNGNLLLTVVAPDGMLAPADRAQRMAQQIESLFAANITSSDVRQSNEQGAVLIRGIPVIRVLPDDAAVLGSAAAVVDRAYREILRAMLQEQVDRIK